VLGVAAEAAQELALAVLRVHFSEVGNEVVLFFIFLKKEELMWATPFSLLGLQCGKFLGNTGAFSGFVLSAFVLDVEKWIF
jgi:hypothetical protein